MSTSKTGTKITAGDIESRLKALQGDVQEKVDDQKTNLMVAAGVVGLIHVVAFYLLGRRSGKRRSTLVEIRRV